MMEREHAEWLKDQDAQKAAQKRRQIKHRKPAKKEDEQKKRPAEEWDFYSHYRYW